MITLEYKYFKRKKGGRKEDERRTKGGRKEDERRKSLESYTTTKSDFSFNSSHYSSYLDHSAQRTRACQAIQTNLD